MKCQLLILSVLINFVQPNIDKKKIDDTTEIEGEDIAYVIYPSIII